MGGNKAVSALAVFVAAAVAVGLVITLVRGESDPPSGRADGSAGDTSATTRPSSSTSEPAESHPSGPNVTVVKIDNVAAARPQTGLAAADMVYVEPVEGGLTRFIAVYFGQPPQVVGPVRSARQSDIHLLAQFGTPTLAYSGAAPELLPLLHDAPLVLASPEQQPAAYFRSNSGSAPHNLYVNAAALPEPAAPAPRPILRFGPAPSGGTPASGYSVSYRSASFSFFWSQQDQRWLISMDGVPMTSAGKGRLTASSVVVQRVPLRDGLHITDASGAVSPVVGTVGSGAATVLRNGLKFTGSWSRPKAELPTRYHTASGAALPLAQGPVWVLLVPH